MREKITFGTWEGEPLTWLVLEETETECTLWCTRNVKTMPFSQSEKPTAYYAESDVRRFLQTEFYEAAFSEEEKARILETELDCTEYQTYYGAVGVGATAYRREPLGERVYLLSVREIMKTYALTKEELADGKRGLIWTRSPDSHTSVSLVDCTAGILRGDDPYTYETRSYDHTTGMVDSMTFPYTSYPTNNDCVVPAVRIRK